MATNKTILNRISTVSLTKQITQTMKMVAASSLEKKKQERDVIREYYKSLQELLEEVGPSLKKFPSSYTCARKVKKVLLICSTTDKGLCGSFSSSVIGGMVDAYQRLKREEKEVVLLPIGKKGATYCHQHKLTYLSIFKNTEKSSLTEIVKELGEFVLKAFEEEVYDEIRLIYQPHVIGPTRNNVVEEELLPIKVTSKDSNLSEANSYLIYEPDPITVHKTVFPQIVRASLSYMISVSRYTEQKARMMAMHQATDNADSLLKELKHLYNRTRQAGITTEINEINAGAVSSQ